MNLKDAADKVKDNEFVQLQNVSQPSRGVYSIRFGSVLDQPIATFPLSSRISGIWRHSGPFQNTTLYHCVPDNSTFPDNTVDLVLTDLADGLGTIFTGGSVRTIRVCYSWIGCGIEQSYNSKNRAAYLSTANLAAASQTGHQVITLGSATNSLQISVPNSFPSGVRGANIFVAVNYASNPTEMVYVGTVTTPGGSLIFRRFIGPAAAFGDAYSGSITATQGLVGSGNLQPGTYYIGAAWLVDSNQVENDSSQNNPTHILLYTTQVQVVVTNVNSAISVSHNFSTSSNGAKNVYIFIGTQPTTLCPMTMVGITAPSENLTITAIPSHNGQSHPFTLGPAVPAFYNACISRANIQTQRFAFMLAKSSGSVYEVFPSRSIYWYGSSANGMADPTVAGGTIPITQNSYYLLAPKSQNDNWNNTQPFNWGFPVLDPVFCHLNGMTYFVNGVDITWMTDAFTLGQLVPVTAATQTILPAPLKSITAYQEGLVGVQSLSSNQVFGSNAGAPQNWATGGTGSALRYVITGDHFGGGCSTLGIFTPGTISTSAENGPSSFILIFKKPSTWMLSNIPDPTASAMAGLLGGQIPATMTQVSGSVGCVAPKAVVQTPLGTLFFGTDANIYMINAVREPQRIGTKVQNLLLHLVGNDAAMQQVTAVYHDRHLKLSYPSPASVAAGAPYVNDYELWADLRTEEGPIIWMGPHVGRNIGPQIVLSGDGDDNSRLVVDSKIIRTYTADSISTLADLSPTNTAQTIVVQITGKQHRFNSDSHFKRIFGEIFDLFIDNSYTNTILLEGFSDANYSSVNRTLSNGGAVWDSSQFDQSTYADAIWEGFSFFFPPQINLVGRTYQQRLTKSDQSPFVLASTTILTKTEKRKLVN